MFGKTAEEKRRDEAVEATLTEGTYSTVVRPHQLKRGDLFTESISMRDRYTRVVMIDSVVNGEIKYRGVHVPVMFVTGRDTRNRDKVIYTRTSWDFMEVTRTGKINRPAVPAVTEYVY